MKARNKKSAGHAENCELLTVITELESVAQAEPDGWKHKLLDWVSACQAAYHIDNTPGHRFGGLGSNLEENRAAVVEYVEELLTYSAAQVQSKQTYAADAAMDGMKRLSYQFRDGAWYKKHDTKQEQVNQQLLAALKELRDAYQGFMGVPAVKANAAIAAAESADQGNNQIAPEPEGGVK